MEEDSTPFLDKMNDVCEMQVASQDYMPIVINEEIVRSLQPDEVISIFRMMRSVFISLDRSTSLIILSTVLLLKSNTTRTWFQTYH